MLDVEPAAGVPRLALILPSSKPTQHFDAIALFKPTLAITDASAFIPAVISLLTSRLTLLSGNCTGRLR